MWNDDGLESLLVVDLIAFCGDCRNEKASIFLELGPRPPLPPPTEFDKPYKTLAPKISKVWTHLRCSLLRCGDHRFVVYAFVILHHCIWFVITAASFVCSL
ncbi:hypothetical protein L1987_50340 [Smallanthus sonchifolius]|uniref:Uncharacterized protein n=1 Tax=Smallanthus sonchifolius TaxID=185202 RepID=A0ACB9ELN7_9ASTR|nr:hypothetical protein L1987_50340 [Smallanthus sonchifolius]